MDRIDRKKLALMQTDDSRPLAELASLVGLSRTGCWHRIRRLEAHGIIRQRVALLDAALLGQSVTAFVTFKLADKSEETMFRVVETVRAMPEAVEFHRVTGGDYLLKLLLAGVEDYEPVYRALIALAPISTIGATFSLDMLKYTTEVPLGLEAQG